MAYSRSSKEKALGELSKYEEADQRVNIGITIEKRNVDGGEIVVARLDRNSFDPMDEVQKRALPKEYTDMEAFGECVSTVLKEISSQL